MAYPVTAIAQHLQEAGIGQWADLDRDPRAAAAEEAFQFVQLGLAHGAVQAQPDGLRERRIDARENGATAGDLERRRAAGRAAERLRGLRALNAARQG